MKGDVPAPALRLLNALPVRTHMAPEIASRAVKVGPKGQKGIRVNGVEYSSLSEARVNVGVAFKTLHRMVQSGEAEYV